MYYEQQKLGYSEFCTQFDEELSNLITNQAHRDEFENFYLEAKHKFFEMYARNKTEFSSVNDFVRVFEVVLYAMFKFKPSVDLPDDIIKEVY